MAAEHDLDPVPPPSRAAQVLDQMLRAGPAAEDPVEGPRRRSIVRAGSGRRLGGAALAGAALVAAAIVVVVLVVLDRPPPIEERLPLAADTASTDDTRDALADPAAAGDTARDTAADGVAAGDTAASDGESSADGPSGGGPDSGQVVVHVAGAVAAPGVVRLGNGSRVVDAVTAAGGLRADADPDRVNLAATLVDGQRVVVPIVGQPIPAEVAPAPVPSSGGTTTAAGASSGAASTGAPVDLNTATAEQLDALPGVGPSTAAAILDHRSSAGPFTSVDQLLDVRGIGEAKLEALRDLVSVGP
jgi:competence protein ComEA